MTVIQSTLDGQHAVNSPTIDAPVGQPVTVAATGKANGPSSNSVQRPRKEATPPRRLEVGKKVEKKVPVVVRWYATRPLATNLFGIATGAIAAGWTLAFSALAALPHYDQAVGWVGVLVLGLHTLSLYVIDLHLRQMIAAKRINASVRRKKQGKGKQKPKGPNSATKQPSSEMREQSSVAERGSTSSERTALTIQVIDTDAPIITSACQPNTMTTPRVIPLQNVTYRQRQLGDVQTAELRRLTRATAISVVVFTLLGLTTTVPIANILTHNDDASVYAAHFMSSHVIVALATVLLLLARIKTLRPRVPRGPPSCIGRT